MGALLTIRHFHRFYASRQTGDTPTETYYVLAGSKRILAGTDLITVAAP